MPIIETITRGSIIRLVAEALGILVAEGTADSGTTTTLVDTALVQPNDNQLRDNEVRIIAGTGADQARPISAFTASSDTITWLQTGTAPTTTSVYIVLARGWNSLTIARGIDEAIRAARHYLLLPKTNRELSTGDILWGYGQFQRWTNGASSAPDGWTLGANGTVAREATELGGYLRYAAALTSDGTNAASLRRSVRNYQHYAGERVNLRGLIRTDTASRVTIAVDDGITTRTSAALTATGDWRSVSDISGADLSLTELTVGDNPTRLRVSLDISAGGAVVARFARIRLLLKSRALELYEMPVGDELTPFVYLHTVEMSKAIEPVAGNDGGDSRFHGAFANFNGRPQDFDILDLEGTKYLALRPRVGIGAPVYSRGGNGVVSPLVDHGLQLVGYAAPALPTADTTNVEVDAEYLVAYAAWYTLRAHGPTPQEGVETWRRRVNDWEAQWRGILRSKRTRPMAGSILVETR